jgi:hypothetical protein
MQMTVTIPEETYARIQAARRSATFKKVPPTSGLVRQLIEEGLSRMEAEAKAAQKAPTAEVRS